MSHSFHHSVSHDDKKPDASTKTSQGRQNYTIINHQARIALQINLTEYCIFDLIHHLATNQKNTKNGWCYAKKETIAKYLSLNRATVFRAINKGLAQGLLEKHPKDSSLLRATKKWYTAVQIKQTTSDRRMYSQPSQTATSVARDSRKMRPNKDNSSNNKNDNFAEQPQKNKAAVGTLLDTYQLPDPMAISSSEWQVEAVRIWQTLGLAGDPSPQFFKHIKLAYVNKQQRKLANVIGYCKDARGIRNMEKFFYWRYASEE